MAADHTPGPIKPSHTQPVRPVDDEERGRLARARASGPFVAWRDAPGVLRIHGLQPGLAVSVGRSAESTITFEHVFLSRRHARIELRVLRVAGEPDSASVLLRDVLSKYGVEHRLLKPGEEDVSGSPLARVPRRPAHPFQLDAGDHDVRLAGEVWIFVGGVPVDKAKTKSRTPDVKQPTPRERQVLVELCRNQFAAGDRPVPTPSNSEIAGRLIPPIGQARVSDLLSQLYQKYDLTATKEQNRFALVELAREHRLVGPEDYM